MKFRNARSWVKGPPLQAYAAALAIVAAAFALRWAMQPLVGPNRSFQFFFVACVITEYFFGPRPALASMVLGTVLGMYFFVKPYQSFSVLELSDFVTVIGFFTVCLLAIAIIELLRRSLYSHQLLLKVADSRYLMLMRRDNELMVSGRNSRKMIRQLEKLFGHLDQVWLISTEMDRQHVLAPFYRYSALAAAGDPGRDWAWLSVVHPDDRLRIKELLEFPGCDERRFKMRFRTKVDGYREMNWSLASIELGTAQFRILSASETPPIETAGGSGPVIQSVGGDHAPGARSGAVGPAVEPAVGP